MFKHFFILILFFVGCGKELPTQSEIGTLFFPTTSGSWWKYDVARPIYSNPDSTINSELTITIVSSTTRKNNEIVSILNLNCNDRTILPSIFGTNSNYIWLVQTQDSVSISDSSGADISAYLLRLPLVKGKTWESLII